MLINSVRDEAGGGQLVKHRISLDAVARSEFSACDRNSPLPLVSARLLETDEFRDSLVGPDSHCSIHLQQLGWRVFRHYRRDLPGRFNAVTRGHRRTGIRRWARFYAVLKGYAPAFLRNGKRNRQ
jgi:hypothetical protein